jgi:hypothetical protein
MPGQRGIAVRRSRGSWAVRIAGAAGVIAAAAIVVGVLVLTQGTARARRQAAGPLPRNVISAVTVGLVNPGPPPGRDSRPVSELLYLSATGLAFTASGGAAQASPTQEWTADQMGDRTYILIYVPDGRCLTAPGAAGAAGALLARCDLSRSQRWRHQFLGKDPAGRNDWQLRNAADGRCLTVARAPLGGQPGESGVGLVACGSSGPWRQIVSFQTAY